MFINFISFDYDAFFMLRLLRHTIIYVQNVMFRAMETCRQKLSGDNISI